MQALVIILVNFISKILRKIPIWMTVNIVSLKILLEMVFVMMKLIFTVAILMMAIVVERLMMIALVYNANVGVCLEFTLPPVDLYLIFEKYFLKNQVQPTGFLVYFEVNF